MGILNVTDDSFYDGGRYRTVESALRHAETMATDGADVIDIGAEKAGPGKPVSAAEEIERVVPVIDAIKQRLSIRLSVDTWKPEVAAAAVEAGAEIINSIGGFDDPAMRTVASRTGAAIILMHIQGRPRVHQPNPIYRDVVRDVTDWLTARADLCVESGISPERIMIDPGPGFGKTSEHDLDLIRHIDTLTALPYPVVLAASRKPFIGAVLGDEVEDRIEGSLAVVAWGVQQGVKLVRVHDVRATVRVVRMVEAVLQARWPVEESV